MSEINLVDDYIFVVNTIYEMIVMNQAFIPLENLPAGTDCRL